MSQRAEPPWLTWFFIIVGGLIILAAGVAIQLIYANWQIVLLLTMAGVGLYWFIKSPFAFEWRARTRTKEILSQASIAHATFPEPSQFADRVITTLLGDRDRSAFPCYQVLVNLMHAADEIYAAEALSVDAIPPPPPVHDSLEGARYRDRTLQHLRKLKDKRTLDVLADTFEESYSDFVRALPGAALQSGQDLATIVSSLAQGQARPATLSVPIVDVLPEIGQRVEDVILPFYSNEAHELGLFADLREQLDRNMHAVSEVPFDILHKGSGDLVMPAQSEAEPRELVRGYLRGTPLEQIFSTEVPFELPEQSRFEHMHIVAGTGWGKSQTLQHFLLADLHRPDPPGLVVIDSQGEMLKKIARLAIFNETLRDKLIYIDPTDVDYPPALNMFDVSRFSQYGKAKREQFLNGLIELLEYVFAGLLKAELTQKQNVLFRYALRLMLHVPGATLNDLVKFLGDPTPYLKHVSELSETAQEFFHTEFSDKTFIQTRQQIRRRLFGVLENDAFRRMFTAPQNRLDMLAALNDGSIVLVDTAKSHLKEDASSLLGRYFIALTLQAALERSEIPAQQRKPAFLYVDEAGEYFDENIDTFLNETRKQRVGCVMAHQYLDQLTPQLRSSIATNTSIKFAGGISDRDAKFLAPEMRTTAEFIAEQKKQRDSTSFACYVRNYTPQAISISVPFFTLERQPVMSEAEFRELRQAIRDRICMPDMVQQPPTLAPEQPPTPPFTSQKTTSQPTSADDWSG